MEKISYPKNRRSKKRFLKKQIKQVEKQEFDKWSFQRDLYLLKVCPPIVRDSIFHKIEEDIKNAADSTLEI